MSSAALLNAVGEYALLTILFLLIFGMISRTALSNSRRSAVVLALFVLIAIIGSNSWPAIRALYIYFFAVMALLAKFIGTLSALQASAGRFDDQYPVFKTIALMALAASIISLEFADVLLAPLVQANIPAMWWRAAAWMIPALGVAMTIKDSARAAVQNILPAVNPRILLFLLVFTAGLLVPLYFPTIDQSLRLAAFAGIGAGFILVFTPGRG